MPAMASPWGCGVQVSFFGELAVVEGGGSAPVRATHAADGVRPTGAPAVKSAEDGLIDQLWGSQLPTRQMPAVGNVEFEARKSVLV